MPTSIIRLAFSVSASLALVSCAGIGGPFCKSGHNDPRVAALMKDTCEGDRGAAMQLGLWFESRAEYEMALRYYRAAAASSSGQTYIYVPPAGDVAGYVMPVDTGPRLPGNAEAMYRLGLMYRNGQGVEASEKRAMTYFQQAAELGHADAIALVGRQSN